jgi:choline kinase
MKAFDLTGKEASYLVALLEADRQTALQLLAADHFYQPSLLPRLKKFLQAIKNERAKKEAEGID